MAPKVCAAGTEGYREEEASSPQQHSWQLELQLFKGILPLLTWHSGRRKASSLVPLWNKSSAVSDVHVIQDPRYGAVAVQQLFKISLRQRCLLWRMHRWVVTSHTHLQQQVFNPCSRIQVVTLLNVLLPAFPRIRLRIKLWTRSLRSVVGGRYPNLHFLSLHVLAPQQREQRGQGRGTGKNKLGPTDRYVELWNFELFWYSTYLPYFAGVGAWSGCPCKKKLGLTPPKINCRYYQECLLFNVQWCFCSAVTCTPVQKGVPEQIQQKCSQYFSLYLIGISLISGSSKGPTLVAVFTKLLKICAYSLKYRFALVLMFFLQKNCQIQGKSMPNFRFVQETFMGISCSEFLPLPPNKCLSLHHLNFQHCFRGLYSD